MKLLTNDKVSRRLLRRSLLLLALLFVLANFVAFMHAYKFTHFSEATTTRTADPKLLSTGQKISTVVMGIDNPRPKNAMVPLFEHKTVRITAGEDQLECWWLQNDNAKGTVILFHGYSGKKSDMLDRAYEFFSFGYSVFLVDFVGSGGSTGNATSIGYHESGQVKAAFDYIASFSGQDDSIFLFGTSMGAAAILKAMHDYPLTPTGILLECPFGSLYKTTCARFNNMGVPSFPMAYMLLFWGGVQNNFWALGHNPSEYAHAVTCPSLLIYGERDDRVSKEETKEIFENLNGPKVLASYEEAGHNDLYSYNNEQWRLDVSKFLKSAESNVKAK